MTLRFVVPRLNTVLRLDKRTVPGQPTLGSSDADYGLGLVSEFSPCDVDGPPDLPDLLNRYLFGTPLFLRRVQGLKRVNVPFGGACHSSGLGMNLVLGRVTSNSKAFPITFAAVVRFGLVWDRRNLTGNWC
jgi:hypothetical protein